MVEVADEAQCGRGGADLGERLRCSGWNYCWRWYIVERKHFCSLVVCGFDFIQNCQKWVLVREIILVTNPEGIEYLGLVIFVKALALDSFALTDQKASILLRQFDFFIFYFKHDNIMGIMREKT